MPEYTIDAVSIGCDWLTVTAKEGPQVALLREYGIELMMADAAKGNKIGPYKMARFYGGHTKHIGVAEWHGRVLVAVGGAMADQEAPELLKLAQNVSRIDLQVSVRQEPYDALLAYDAWLVNRRERLIEGRPAQYDLYARAQAGTTLYIGDGNSRYLARLYERWQKTKDAGEKDVWRYEVEAKRERAAQVAGLYQSANYQPDWTAGFVHQHFARRGVEPIYSPSVAVTVPPLQHDDSDKTSSLRWLSKSVAPVIRRLEGWGASAEWRKALGLPAEGQEDDDDPPGDFPHP